MICHVYKRGRLYWGKLQLDTDARMSRFPLGTTDKRIAQTKLLETAKEREKEAAGLLPPLTVREAAKRPLNELLAAFLDDLRAKGRADATAAKYRKTLGKLFGRARWGLLADVTARSFCEWRAQSGLSPKTLNDLLGALMTFLTWLYHQRFAMENPLVHVQRIDTRATRQQYRRALNADELRRLLTLAPADRRMIYLFAVSTGIRRGEMLGLRWEDVTLDGDKPSVRARASITKNRKDSELPLTLELARLLRSYRPVDMAPFAPVFLCGLPNFRTFRRDLVRAGVPFKDEQDRRIDFHALRVTFCTNLSLAKVDPRTVMALMRHSDLRLTMKTYTDAAQLQLAEAVAKLPEIGLAEVCPETCPRGGLQGSQGVAS